MVQQQYWLRHPVGETVLRRANGERESDTGCLDQTEGHREREISESGASHGRGEAGRASEQRVNLFELRVMNMQ